MIALVSGTNLLICKIDQNEQILIGSRDVS